MTETKTKTTELQGFLDALAVGVAILDSNDRLLYANAPATVMWDRAATLEGVTRDAIFTEFVKSRNVERGRAGWVARVLGPTPAETVVVQVVAGTPIRWQGKLAQPYTLVALTELPQAQIGGPYIFGRFRLDNEHATVMYGRDYVELSTVEFRLLSYFCAHADRLIHKEDLLRDVWGRRATNTRTLDVTVSRLRRKLVTQGCPEEAIHTVHGRGYCFLARLLVEKG